MMLDPVQYTELIEEVRTLKALNDALTFQNQSLIQQVLAEKKQKEQLQIQFIQFKQKLNLQHQQLLQSCKNQVAKITDQLSTKKLQEMKYFQMKMNELQKGSHHRLKAIQIQFKDFRLKSHLNDQFVNKILKLYPEDHNPGLPELYSWIKKMLSKQKKPRSQNHFGDLQKENRKLIMSKTLQKDKSKKRLFGGTK